MRKTLLTAALSLMLAAAAPAGAFETLRCGRDLVLIGDHVVEVIERCGEPAYQSRRIGYFTREKQHFGRWKKSELEVPVYFDDLVYNFGPSNFMYELRFVDGYLRTIRSLGRGH